MTVYPERVNERLRSLRHAAPTGGANGSGTCASFECGCFARIWVVVDSETKTIRRAGFQTNGCGFMTAAADVAAEDLSGTALTDLHSLDREEFLQTAENALGRFPRERGQCAAVVLEAVRSALADYRAYVIEEFAGEKALICTCFGVSEETIEAFIAEAAPASIDEVTRACRAGGGCGSCRMLIQEMLDQARR